MTEENENLEDYIPPIEDLVESIKANDEETARVIFKKITQWKIADLFEDKQFEIAAKYFNESTKSKVDPDDNMMIAGHTWRDIKAKQQGEQWSPSASKSGDHGSDPLGDGKHRMIPSGDIVDTAERMRRLKK